MYCSILTFHFAHNYGAMLQGYSLLNHLEKQGYEVNILNYVPQKLKNEYSLNPLARDKHPKAVIRRFKSVPIKSRQVKIFNVFQEQYLKCKNNVTDINVVKIKKGQAVIFGSDQIWNENITGENGIYYGDFLPSDVVKISYAGSFGAKTLSNFQKKCVIENLSNFKNISVREKDAINLVKQEINREVELVVDPVFLNTKDFWSEFSQKADIEIKEKFILYYSLKDNNTLIKKAEQLAKNSGYKLIVIHPTCNKQKVMGEQIYNVGPLEFLWLIKNAQYICTNSFHATSFSLIFQKKTLHVPHSHTESRVESLLKAIYSDNVPYEKKHGVELLDFENSDETKLKDWIDSSKVFLNNSLT